MKRSLFGALCALLFTVTAAHATVSITPAESNNGGSDLARVEFADGTVINVQVDLDGTEGRVEKGAKIKDAMTAAGVDASIATFSKEVVLKSRTSNGSAVTAVTYGGRSGENQDDMSANNAQSGTGIYELEGIAQGQDVFSNEASYMAGFNFEGVNTQSFHVASDFAMGFTTQDVLSALFNDLQSGLPPQFQPLLILDLGNNLISFQFPESEPSFGISGGTTDAGLQGASITLEFTPVPEPSTFVLGTLGLLAFGLYGWRRKRRA